MCHATYTPTAYHAYLHNYTSATFIDFIVPIRPNTRNRKPGKDSNRPKHANVDNPANETRGKYLHTLLYALLTHLIMSNI